MPPDNTDNISKVIRLYFILIYPFTYGVVHGVIDQLGLTIFQHHEEPTDLVVVLVEDGAAHLVAGCQGLVGSFGVGAEVIGLDLPRI